MFFYYKLRITWLNKTVKNKKRGMGTFDFRTSVAKDKKGCGLKEVRDMAANGQA